jgi:hypothetical protein
MRLSNVSLSEIGITESILRLYFGTLASAGTSIHLAIDTAGNLFVASTFSHCIRKVTSAGVVTTLAGTAGVTGNTDGYGSAARFYGPSGVAVDTAGNLFVSDTNNSTIRSSAQILTY